MCSIYVVIARARTSLYKQDRQHWSDISYTEEPMYVSNPTEIYVYLYNAAPPPTPPHTHSPSHTLHTRTHKKYKKKNVNKLLA